MLAFTETEVSRDQLLASLQAHAKADAFEKGSYWQNNRGCAVGCSLHDFYPGREAEHSLYEQAFGVPRTVARLEDAIFEGLPGDASRIWPLRFTRAIRVGADLSRVTPAFLFHVVQRRRDAAAADKNLDADVCALLLAATDEVLAVLATWRDTGDSADSAAWSADSAWSAAWSAADARSAADSARSAADSARSADSAARSAADSARSAWSAAESAAESAESAAESAWSAADSAAESAWSAARSAWSAADSAAESAWSAADSAAESAAWSAWSARSARSARSAEYEWMAETLIAEIERAPLGHKPESPASVSDEVGDTRRDTKR